MPGYVYKEAFPGFYDLDPTEVPAKSLLTMPIVDKVLRRVDLLGV